MVKLSSSTASGWRNSGPSAAAMTSSRSAIRRSRFSSPSTTSMSCPSWRPVRPSASSSAWPSAMVIGVRSWCEASWRNLRWVASSRAFSSPNRRDSCSAVSLRLACHTMARNMAAMSGTSVSSATDSVPRATSTPMAAAVVAMTTPSTASVGRGAQVRNPYTSVKLIQMKWKGTVSQPANAKIATRLTAENAAHTGVQQRRPERPAEPDGEPAEPRDALGEAAISRRQADSPHRAPS